MWLAARIARYFDDALRVFRRILRDVVAPVAGFFVLYQLATAHIPSSYAPFMVPLCAALLGIPIWSRQDERRNDGDDQKSRRRGLTIRIGGDDDVDYRGRDRGGDRDA